MLELTFLDKEYRPEEVVAVRMGFLEKAVERRNQGSKADHGNSNSQVRLHVIPSGLAGVDLNGEVEDLRLLEFHNLLGRREEVLPIQDLRSKNHRNLKDTFEVDENASRFCLWLPSYVLFVRVQGARIHKIVVPDFRQSVKLLSPQSAGERT